MTPVSLLTPQRTLSKPGFAGILFDPAAVRVYLGSGQFLRGPHSKGTTMKTIAKFALVYAACAWALMEGIAWLLGVV